MNIKFNPNLQVQSELPSLRKPTPAQAHKNFSNVLKDSINQLNQAQIESDRLTDQLANGQAVDLHNVMISAQKASITLETAVQIQQKVIDAYNEIMRMQV